MSSVDLQSSSFPPIVPGPSGRWSDKHQVFLLQEPVGMCGTSPAAEVGNVHQLQPPANNAPPPPSPLAIPHKSTSNCRLSFVVFCSCQWNQPLLSVFATISVFALSHYRSYATVALPQDWKLTECKPPDFNLCFAAFRAVNWAIRCAFICCRSPALASSMSACVAVHVDLLWLLLRSDQDGFLSFLCLLGA